MKSTPDNPLSGGAISPGASFDETLRLITQAPVPAGLEGRVQAALDAAPRHGRVLYWPHRADSAALSSAGAWLRTAAAAAIVFVVAGGGWGVYRRVQRPVAKVIVMPVAQPAAAGGFSAAGAIRTPDTVKGPVLVQPAAKPLNEKDKQKVTTRPAAPKSATAVAQPKPSPVAASR